MSSIYDHSQIEAKWQKILGTNKKNNKKLKKLYLLFAFAYPSGSGLHVGHVESKTALDILARFYRMNEREVFFPVGWDAFGLPAENYAIKTGIHPRETTLNAIKTFKKQIKRLGISYDWDHELATCEPDYYRWTQWLFLQLFNKGLAYRAQGKVNWCPSCQTVLANEQVIDGLCERCDSEVTQKDLKQWYFKITKYKDELVSGLEQVDWPEATKKQQLNWIGKKTGAEVKFEILNSKLQTKLKCFTTRLDTIYGVSYLVISPEKFLELNLLDGVEKSKQKEVKKYLAAAKKKTEEERQIGQKDKTGVDTGLFVNHPLTGEKIPLWVADYVLAHYGTGIVMGVPAHDERDLAFAQKFNLKILSVVKNGKLVNSKEYNNLSSQEAQQKLLADFPKFFKKITNYKLRDWLISRQRYWGAPIPIVYDPDGKPHPVKEEHLPWKLPIDVDFKPTGESPLKSSQEFKKRVEDLYGKGWTPEYDTMDTFVDSSWYYLRYPDANNNQEFASKKNLNKWLPVDFYMIGPEHIVLHLLYSRFFTKFLRDEGYLDFDEPFLKMRHQGMILGPDGKKMSKSKGNVISPDEIIEKFGADTLRMYEMFMGPIDADKPWDIFAVNGVYKFLGRVYKLVVDWQENKSSGVQLRKLHQTLAKVSRDIPQLKFNTAIASMMELVNLFEDEGGVKLSQVDLLIFIKFLFPFVPFLASDLFEKVTGEVNLASASWPKVDQKYLVAEELHLPVQINGKTRAELIVDVKLKNDQAELVSLAKQNSSLQKWLHGKEIKKIIYVPGRILNFVI